MNNNRRKMLREIIDLISNGKDMLENIREEEEGALCNIPENLQGGERYENIENTVDSMDEAIDSLETVIGELRALT